MSRTFSDIQRMADERIVAMAESNSAAFGGLRAALPTRFPAAVDEQRSQQSVQYDDDGNEVAVWLLGDAVGSEPI